jgi:hypothetical protein
MSITLAPYDVTELFIKQDTDKDGSIDQSGAWEPLPVSSKKRVFFGIGEERLKHYGNSQSLLIDKRVKQHGLFEFEYLLKRYESSPSPAFDWWNFINYAFYGGATGAPALRPGSAFIAAKLNWATPEYWALADAKIEQVVISGSMIRDAVTAAVRGISRFARLDTNNFIQGTATKRAAPATTAIHGSDVLIKINNIDESEKIQGWSVTLARALELRGKAATVSGSSSQIASSGMQYREIVPNTFSGRIDLEIDPYGTGSTQLLNYLNDTELATCEIRIANETNAKNIQFTASKINDAKQTHEENKSPSVVSLSIEGSTFNVATL